MGKIRRDQVQPPKHPKPADQKHTAATLQKEKETVSKFAKGRLGAGKPPQFSTQAPSEQKKVAKAVKNAFHLSKG